MSIKYQSQVAKRTSKFSRQKNEYFLLIEKYMYIMSFLVKCSDLFNRNYCRSHCTFYCTVTVTVGQTVKFDNKVCQLSSLTTKFGCYYEVDMLVRISPCAWAGPINEPNPGSDQLSQGDLIVRTHSQVCIQGLLVSVPWLSWQKFWFPIWF